MKYIQEMVSKWESVAMWFRPQEFKNILMATFASIKRSVKPIARVAAVFGLILALFVAPFWRVTGFLFYDNPIFVLTESGVFVLKLYQDHFLGLMPSQILGVMAIFVISALISFSSYLLPILMLRTSIQRKDLDYIRGLIIPSLLFLPVLLIVTEGTLWLFSKIPGERLPVAIEFVIYYTLSSWVAAIPIIFAFFFFDSITGERSLASLWISLGNSITAALFFVPILIVPWTHILNYAIYQVIYFASVILGYLPQAISPATLMEKILILPPLIQQLIFTLVPVASVVMSAILGVLIYSFYATIYLKMKHESPELFSGRASGQLRS